MANDISKLITPDGVSHDVRDATANKAIYHGQVNSSSPDGKNDFNNLLVVGSSDVSGNDNRIAVYWCQVSGMLNAPESSGYGYLECISTLQRYTNYSTKNVFLRTYVNSTWSAWIQSATPDISGKVNRSGDTMTGSLRAIALTALTAGSPKVSSQSTDIDASKTDNNVSTDHYPGFAATDKFDRTLTRMESVASSNGNIAAYWYVRNYNTSGSQVAQKGIKITMAKDGSITYSVDDASKFRTAIGHPFEWDINTENTTGTWVPVMTGSTMQHRVLSATYNGKSVVGATSSAHNLPSYSNSVIPSTQYLAYWNGAYDSSGHSNIQYCDRGRLGTIVTAGGTSQVSYTRVNGNVSNDAKCWRFGNVVVFTGYFGVSVSNLAKGTQLWNGFPKPKCDTYFHARCEGNRMSYDFYITVNGVICTNQANIPAGTYLVNVTWIC